MSITTGKTDSRGDPRGRAGSPPRHSGFQVSHSITRDTTSQVMLRGLCLCLTYFTSCDHLQVHPSCFRWRFFILLMAESYSTVYLRHIYFIHVPCQQTFSLLPCLGYCEQGFYEHWGCRHLFKLELLSFLDTCPGVGLQGHVAALLPVF